eukprot:gnl/MRDRNA2_/MRDRNA2_87038_c0_seq1.p1 gnl/MRDRNA2_/MRDRNA2_87038_c0~~gnl/MRDRNA2_/MRDRNA2_87038_c0_seq1.p1  ORF type:complete len:248 (+),score=35.29 gnl/MRDRNA2_/MRDRNA2_87038_c0_seq1:107-745(+)
MGATQACSSIDRMRPSSYMGQEPLRNSRTDVAAVRHRTIIGLWVKCKDAVVELSRFQKFLRRRYSEPSHAFSMIFKECIHTDGERITREDFVHHIEKSGFKGDSGALFVMLKDSADECVTRFSFCQRIKIRDDKRGQRLLAVVKQAVATAELVDQGVEEDSERFQQIRTHSWRSPREADKKRRTSPGRPVSKERSRSPTGLASRRWIRQDAR